MLNEEVAPQQPPRSGGCVQIRESMGVPALVRMMRTGARIGGIQPAQRDVAETVAANRWLFVAARSGGFDSAHHQREIVLDSTRSPCVLNGRARL